MCTRFQSDEELVATNFKSKEVFESKFKEHYEGKIYRRDILPCRVYLKHCLMAASKLGEDFEMNFKKHSYLADRKTTIEDYLNSLPTLIESTSFGKFNRYQG